MWTLHREAPTCPQCKAPFEFLQTYRAIDGTLSDYPQEEHICLLKRAPWFVAYSQAAEAARTAEAVPAAARRAAARQDRPPGVRGADDSTSDEMDDDAELEDFYYSAAAGRARIVFGNRRFGANGVLAAGRLYARPAPEAAAPPGRGKKGGRGGGAAAAGPLPGSSPPTCRGGAGPSGSRAAAASPSAADAAPKPGRRALRNARRAAGDAAGRPGTSYDG